ncbi:MAG TPA: hypothetical protein VLU25_19925 [Acidobacteriota bacterium]|nr:hypothetical protein [Acidobacteriota bacterium]
MKKLLLGTLLGLVCVVAMAAAWATEPEGPSGLRFDQPLTWTSPSGAPISFETEEEALEFLRTAKIVKMKQISEGLNKTRKVLLEKDGVQMNAAFRDVASDRQIPDPRLEGAMQNHRDDAIFEVAAFRLSRMLGLKVVPPTVLREVDGKMGSMQAWVENATMDKERRAQGNEPPDEWLWIAQMLTMHFFDNLIANTDRHQGNLLIDPDWNIWLIDHTQGFRRFRSLHDPDKVQYIDREVWENLLKLDRKALERAFSDVLRDPEIRALAHRRDLIVKQVKKLIKERGEANVIFSADL